ncbi:Panacea domain-containing protein [Niameybacter massiliensis]|uniref:Panacea domain-containing protein n=1 Tax=Niameybacter massiliensis TaxID=1658108 RepID=UPI0006B4951A|nr:type II toxin-antitoxin system antitoxin SocA domain-containing protein [Niameybacter massiliensis]
MAYKALDIAKYVINYCIDIQDVNLISNLKLQKIMYYIQAAFLVETGDLAFNEKISAWRYGPVVEMVYHEFKRYVNSGIDERIDTELVLKNENARYVYKRQKYNPNEKFIDEHKEIINKVIHGQNKFTAFQLVARTHEEYPWMHAIENDEPYIDIDDMRRYFTQHGERIYGE